jgi:hypothetical protein
MYSRFAWLIIMGSGFDDWIGTSLQLLPIITAHSQWFPKTCSVPCWTTWVFSTVTNAESLLTPWTAFWLLLRMNHDSFITSRGPEYKSPCRPVPLLFCSFSRESVFSDLPPTNDSFVAIRCSGNVITEPLLSNGHPLWLHYSGFQAVFTEPLPNNGLFRHNTKHQRYGDKPAYHHTTKRKFDRHQWTGVDERISSRTV